MRVLVVEDDFLIAKAVRDALERDGHEVAVASRGEEALSLVDRWKPDVVLLDLILPDMDGRDIARRIRADGDTPIIVVTARGDESDRVAGLEIGADDYVVKPFSVKELLARVRAVSRRPRDAPRESIRLEHLDLVLEPEEHRALRSGEQVPLTIREFQILRMLMERPGRLVARSEMAKAIWGLSANEAGASLDVHMSSLRSKLGDDPREPRYIETVRGIGFRLVAELPARP